MQPLHWSGIGTEGILTMELDAELEQYRLLAYLQRIDTHYRERKLYPHLDELRNRFDQLALLQARRAEMTARIPRDVIGLDLQQGELLRTTEREDELLQAIDASLAFAIPELRSVLSRGTELREELSERIHLSPVGVLPLSFREGYLLLRQGNEALVYDYAVPLLRESHEELQYRSVRTRFVNSWSISFSSTYDHIKAELVRVRKDIPNPAVFVFESEIGLPRIETFMPLAKQLVYELIRSKAA